MVTESNRTLSSLPLRREPWCSLRFGSTSDLRSSAIKTFAKVNPMWAPEALP